MSQTTTTPSGTGKDEDIQEEDADDQVPTYRVKYRKTKREKAGKHKEKIQCVETEEEVDDGKRVIEMEDEEEVLLEEIAILDTGCSTNIAGRKWLYYHIESLDEGDRREVQGPREYGQKFR